MSEGIFRDKIIELLNSKRNGFLGIKNYNFGKEIKTSIGFTQNTKSGKIDLMVIDKDKKIIYFFEIKDLRSGAAMGIGQALSYQSLITESKSELENAINELKVCINYEEYKIKVGVIDNNPIEEKFKVIEFLQQKGIPILYLLPEYDSENRKIKRIINVTKDYPFKLKERQIFDQIFFNVIDKYAKNYQSTCEIEECRYSGEGLYFHRLRNETSGYIPIPNYSKLKLQISLIEKKDKYILSPRIYFHYHNTNEYKTYESIYTEYMSCLFGKEFNLDDVDKWSWPFDDGSTNYWHKKNKR